MPWLVIVVFTLAGFLTQTTSLMTAGLLPAMASDFAVSEGLAGSLTSVFAIAIVITILPATRLSLRFTRRQVIVATICLLVLSNLLVAFAPALLVALIGRFIGGSAHGLLASAIPSVVTRLVPPRHVAKALGIVLAGNSAGLAVGAPLMAVSSGWLGWRGSFGLMALVGVVLAVALALVVPPLRIAATQAGSLAAVVRTPGVLRLSVSWALMLLGHYAVLTFISPIFLALGGSEAMLGLPLTILGFAGITGVLIAGRISDRPLVAATALSGVLVGIAFLGIGIGRPMWLVLVCLIIWGAASAASLLLNQRGVLLAGFRAPELAMSLALLITQFGIALGSSLGGVTIEHLGPRFVPGTGAAAVCAALLLLIGMTSILRAARTESARLQAGATAEEQASTIGAHP